MLLCTIQVIVNSANTYTFFWGDLMKQIEHFIDDAEILRILVAIIYVDNLKENPWYTTLR